MCYPDFNIRSLCISQAAFTLEKLQCSTISWLLLHVNSAVASKQLIEPNVLVTHWRQEQDEYWTGRTGLNGHCWVMQFNLLQLKAKSLQNHELLLKTNEAVHFYVILPALSRSCTVLRAWIKLGVWE